MERRFNKRLILFIAEGAYAGRFPVAPGTAGTVVGVLLYLLLKGLPPLEYFIACIVIVSIAIVTANQAEQLLGKKDPSSVVIDEIAGYIVSMFLVPAGWIFIAAGFLLFRVFDITKPFPLRRLQNLRGGLGIVVDDVGAGIYTNLVLQLAVVLLK